MSTLARDLRLSVRQLSNKPLFTLTVVLTLGLGIGGTTAIFSLVEGILLHPLPFSNPERLVVLGDHLGNNPGIGVTAGEIGTYAKASSTVVSLGGVIRTSYELSGGATPEEVVGARLTAGVFPTLGVQPFLGRVFTKAEEEGKQPLAVISYSLWLNRYDRNPNILGTSINLDREAYTIIGVMPRSFEFPLESGHLNQSQLWVPMSATADELSPESGMWGYQIVARLKDGVTVSQAAQDTDRVARQIMRDFPASKAALHIRGDVMPLRELAVSGVQPLLRTLFLAVSVVLLIACVNVAGLLLVQAIRQRREYAVRLALGAGSRVILRESLLEGLLLSVAGGALGLALAAIAIRTALHLLPESMPRIASISMDTTVAGFAVLLALVTGGLCSLAPAFVALRTNLTECLKEGDRTGTGAASHKWLRSALVVSEIAIALMLLTASGAFLRSFQKMHALDPGFRPDHVLVAYFQLPDKQYSTHAASDAFDRDIVERLSSKPGIVAVGITWYLPELGSSKSGYTIENEPVDRWKLKFAGFGVTYGDYFRAIGIPLIEGRYFTPDDRSDSLPVMIVNQSMARHAWPGQSAIGKRLHAGSPTKKLPWATVVGVVADTKLGAPDEPSIEQWYAPMQQPAILYGTEASKDLGGGDSGFITLRSVLPPEQMIHLLRSTVAELDPLLPLQQVQTMDDVISKVEAPRRFNTGLISAFAVGAFSAALRTHEIAIRMALGAQRTRIAGLILSSAAKLALTGCTFGVLGSLAASRIIKSLLFDVSATDPLIYLAGVLIMITTAMLACAFPAGRAVSVDPVVSLRSI